eukprot:UN11799
MTNMKLYDGFKKTCYGGTKKGCFNCMSMVVGVALSFVWGLIMGMAQFFLIWMVIPYWKIIKLYYTPAAAVIGALLNSCFGKCLKNISPKGATVNVNSKGAQNNVPSIVSSIQQQDGQQTGYPKLE